MDKTKLADEIRGLPGYDPYRGADDYYFDTESAANAIEFFEKCIVHIKGSMAGKPYLLEPHERAMTANIFGWKHKETHKRRYREVFYYVPRKNSKTTWCAGTALYAFFCDNEPGAECYCAAADREQAALLFGVCEGMIQNNKYMSSLSTVYSSTKTIKLNGKQCIFKAISAEAATKHGYNTHFVVIDELHAQPNRDLVDVLKTSTGARSQPLIIYITTADFDRDSICNEKHDEASMVRDNPELNLTLLPVIYEAKVTDDWKKPSVWFKANPNLGKSISLDWFKGECNTAQMMPSYENTFKRLHLNIKTESDVRWMGMDTWDRNCEEPMLRGLFEKSLHGRLCFAGLDLSATRDLTALSLVFPMDNGDFSVLCYGWLPQEAFHEKCKMDSTRYDMWLESVGGPLSLIPGNAINNAYVRRKVNELSKVFRLRQIAFDRFNASEISVQLEMDGFEMVSFGQGFRSMSSPIKSLERSVLDNQIRHNGCPMLRNSVAYAAVVYDDAGNVKLTKKLSTKRIDPLVALVMGFDLATINKPKPMPQITIL